MYEMNMPMETVQIPNEHNLIRLYNEKPLPEKGERVGEMILAIQKLINNAYVSGYRTGQKDAQGGGDSYGA